MAKTAVTKAAKAEPVIVTNAALVLFGVTQSAEFLNCNTNSAKAWLSAYPTTIYGGKGYWLLSQLAACKNARHEAELEKARLAGNPDSLNDPEAMDPKSRNVWFGSELKRVKLLEEQGELVRVEDMRIRIAAILKPIAQALETMPDILEIQASLSGPQVEIVQTVCDQTRESAYINAMEGLQLVL